MYFDFLLLSVIHLPSRKRNNIFSLTKRNFKGPNSLKSKFFLQSCWRELTVHPSPTETHLSLNSLSLIYSSSSEICYSVNVRCSILRFMLLKIKVMTTTFTVSRKGHSHIEPSHSQQQIDASGWLGLGLRCEGLTHENLFLYLFVYSSIYLHYFSSIYFSLFTVN